MTIERTEERRPSAYAWLVLATLCVVGCLNYLDRMMIATMRSSILEEIPMTETQFGLLTSVFLWIYGLLSPVAGFLADRLGKSKGIIGSLFVWSLVTWLTSRATSFEELLVTRALMGVSEACYIPAALALIMEYHCGKTKSMATGIHQGGIMIGQSLGFVGGWLAENHSWNFAFVVFGGFGVLYSLVLAFVLRDPKEEIKTKAEVRHSSFMVTVLSLFKQKSYAMVVVYWSLISIIGWLVAGWLPTYFKEHFSLSQSVAGVYSTGYYYTASFVGVLIGGYLSDRWSRTNPLARILVPMLGLMLGAPAIFAASNTTILGVAVVCFMIYAFTRSFTDANMMPILSMIVDGRYRATAYGVLNLFSCIVGGIGIYAGGVLRDAKVELSVIFQVASGLVVICILVLWYLKKQNDQPMNVNQ